MKITHCFEYRLLLHLCDISSRLNTKRSPVEIVDDRDIMHIFVQALFAHFCFLESLSMAQKGVLISVSFSELRFLWHENQ